jgi:hypothetical protein
MSAIHESWRFVGNFIFEGTTRRGQMDTEERARLAAQAPEMAKALSDLRERFLTSPNSPISPRTASEIEKLLRKGGVF